MSGKREPEMSRVRVVFLIRKLDIGGAERQLLTLVRELNPLRFEVHVLAMYAGGQLEDAFKEVRHISIQTLDKNGRWDLFGFGARLFRAIRRIKPHIVHGYMGGANELALLSAKLSGAKCVWGIRVSDLDPKEYVWSVGALFRLGATLSQHVDLIIANSERGRQFHLFHHYSSQRFVVVHNGIDTERFSPSPSRGEEWRRIHNISENEVMVVLPARLDPMKDHPLFLSAISKLSDLPMLRAVCVGDGPIALRERYESMAESLKIFPRVRFLPAQRDVSALYAAADVVVLCSSFGEGFPNVLGEAMACGRCCISTDVGDAALILNESTRIVPAGDDESLARAIRAVSTMSTEQRTIIGKAARRRIVDSFSTQSLVKRTEELLAELCSADGQ